MIYSFSSPLKPQLVWIVGHRVNSCIMCVATSRKSDAQYEKKTEWIYVMCCFLCLIQSNILSSHSTTSWAHEQNYTTSDVYWPFFKCINCLIANNQLPDLSHQISVIFLPQLFTHRQTSGNSTTVPVHSVTLDESDSTLVPQHLTMTHTSTYTNTRSQHRNHTLRALCTAWICQGKAKLRLAHNTHTHKTRLWRGEITDGNISSFQIICLISQCFCSVCWDVYD